MQEKMRLEEVEGSKSRRELKVRQARRRRRGKGPLDARLHRVALSFCNHFILSISD